jgi:hypothetical protein
MLSEDERIAAVDRIVAPAVQPIRGADPLVQADKALRRADQLPARPDLSKLAVGVVADTLTKLLNGKIKIANASQARQILDACYGIVRLEAGEATSITQMSNAELMASIRQFRDKADRDKAG